jgi:hypothetical protein
MSNGQIFWIADAFPEDLEYFLTDEMEKYEFGSDVESDDLDFYPKET